MNKRKFLPVLFFLLSLKLVAQTPTMGLIINDSAAYTGYTLLIPKNATSTYLIDNEGLLVHQWDHQYRPAMTAYLLENGNLLRSTLLPVGNKAGGFQEIDWDEENDRPVWKELHEEQSIKDAAALAARSDVAIVIAGTNLSVANEAADRTNLDLPGNQAAIQLTSHIGQRYPAGNESGLYLSRNICYQDIASDQVTHTT